MTYVVGGAQTNSKTQYPAGTPRHADYAVGGYVYAGGRQYVDCVAALGPVILGHQHAEVDYAVRLQMQRGVSFSLPTRLEQELADIFGRLIPCAEAVRFAKNGADVTGAAVRIARAHTVRDVILICDGAYHGHHGWSMGRPPKNGGVFIESMYTRYWPRFDLDRLEEVLEEGSVAAVIMEPVLSSDPIIPPDGYFQRVRELCDQYGTLLIFDEMVTGWRAGLPGYPTGVVPDMACYGKAMANGYPLSALVGRRDLLERMERDVFFSTTFGGEALSLAASIATLTVLEREHVAEVLAQRGEALRRDYAEKAARYQIDTELYGYPSRLVMRFGDAEERRIFLEHMVANGVLTHGYFNLMYAHDDDALARMRTAIEASFQAIAAPCRIAA